MARLPRDGRDTLFLLAVIAWLVLPQVARLPLWCGALVAGVLAWRAWLAVSGGALPRSRWVVLLLLAAVGATMATHNTLLGRDAGVTLIVVLLALKTLELRARRDAFVVFFLGFFTLLTNFFYSQSLLTAVAMLVGLLGLLTTLVLAHMPVGKPSLAAAARLSGRMALLGAPVMVVLFVLFPRLAPLWGLPSDGMAGRSGLSSSMEVGSIASLVLDESIAMRVRFLQQRPPQQYLYFRGPVLSSFDGRRWQPLRASLPTRYALKSALEVSGEALAYEVTLEPTNHPWLMVLDAAAEAPQGAGLAPQLQADLQWTTRSPITDLTRYTAKSHLEFRHGPAQPVIGLQEFVDLPPGYNPRTLQLAADIRRDPRYAQAGTATLVAAVMERLRTGGYGYTLDPGVYGADTADEFWFDRKEGFCEHIASAFVVLMRALDVPARIVTGYQGGELNGVDGYWTVRQSDAHAWAEVWQAGQGWVRVDPTSAVAPSRTRGTQRLAAPAGLVGGAFSALSPGFVAQVRQVWDAVNNRWNQVVLNYTQTRQLNLLRSVGFTTPDWQDLGLVLLFLVVFATAGGAAWGLWERRQRDPWLRLLDRARAKSGVAARPPSFLPRQLAKDLLAQHGPSAHAAHDWLLRLEACRYAPAARQPATLGQLKREFSRLAWPHQDPGNTGNS
ncbi:MAG: DUF3488 and transglutaminase-like domain-containing protein [Pseudomonadota bacterium]